MFFVACATYKPLTERGLSPEDRREHIVQNGYGLTSEVKDAFLKGYLVKGMSRDLVFQLFGPADRQSQFGNFWEYFDSRKKVITAIKFNEDVAEEILGDPKGGASPDPE